MAGMTWSEAVEVIEPHVVRISTPQGSGTGFLIAHLFHHQNLRKMEMAKLR
jgi:hypothetical protein